MDLILFWSVHFVLFPIIIYLIWKYIKVTVTERCLITIFFIVVYLFEVYKYLVVPIKNSNELINEKDVNKYVDGYLKKGAKWADEYNDVWHMNKLAKTGRVHGNSELTRIEIWNNMPDKDVIVMIYFLEGKFAGRWGYTIKAYTTTENYEE